MDVQVRHRLAGSRTIVDADVVAVGLMLFGSLLFCLVEKGKQRHTLARCYLKERPDMALWNDQAVAWGHRVAIQNQHGMPVLINDATGGEVTEGALVGHWSVNLAEREKHEESARQQTFL
jgi:hypothetical protein